MAALGLPTTEEGPFARSSVRPRYILKFVCENVLERDGYRCRYCGSTENLGIDHIHLHSRDGSNAGTNLPVYLRNRSTGSRANTDTEQPKSSAFERLEEIALQIDTSVVGEFRARN